MGVQDGLAFWNALKGKIQALVKQDTANCLRCARYDVTTAPNGTKIGVRLPEGSKEILIPYSREVGEAQVGDTVLVVWYGAMSTARAYYYGIGYDGYREPTPPAVFTEYLNVYADTGATVTAVCGETTYTGTVQAYDHVTLTVHVAGTYTVTATLGSDTYTGTVSMTVDGATQTIDLRSTGAFTAYLTVTTYPEAEVSVSGYSSLYTGVASSNGTVTFTIYGSDTYTVQAVVDGNYGTRTIAINTNGYFYGLDVPITFNRHYLYLLGNTNEIFKITDTDYEYTFEQEGLGILTLPSGGLKGYGTEGACLSIGNVSVNIENESITCFDARCSQTNFWAFIFGRTNSGVSVTANDGNGHIYSGTATSAGFIAFAVNTSGTYTISEMATSGAQTDTLNVTTTGATYSFDFRTFDGTIYNAGDEYTKFTGGWQGDNTIVATAYDSSVYSYQTPFVYKLADRLEGIIRSGAPSVGSLRTVNKLSVTDYDTLEIRYLLSDDDSGTGTVKLFVHNGSQVRASKTLTRSSEVQTTTLDITPAHGWGTCYIGIEIEADLGQTVQFDLYYAALKDTGTSQSSGGGGLSL